MKKYIYCFCIVTLMSCQTETKQIDVVEVSEDNIEETKAAIKEVMTAQEIAWNNHDLEGFMQGYWRSNSLKFYGSNGLTQGWDNTLANYKKGYPTPAESGTLRFVINDISKIENGNYWVMGEYHLTRPVGDANGVFMIIFKKIDGQWKIIADMSC
ncbi:nuclear transport factor 2 family protein [uncultured Psychroserpens sp.]|uniref:YybH family protein n=1 Tax=uncultured Psychroserpens sp. TaxID=255436 RepID=UPI0026037853|nr:nuclear transport factor 2 family protein [uncultured Psychroserpens sp.]